MLQISPRYGLFPNALHSIVQFNLQQCLPQQGPDGLCLLNGAFCGAFISHADPAKPFIGVTFKVKASVFIVLMDCLSCLVYRERILSERSWLTSFGNLFNQPILSSVPRLILAFITDYSATSHNQVLARFPSVSSYRTIYELHLNHTVQTYLFNSSARFIMTTLYYTLLYVCLW